MPSASVTATYDNLKKTNISSLKNVKKKNSTPQSSIDFESN